MKIIAHRGDSKSNPENTLLAFKEAIKKGADAIELDVHLSLDKQLIVHHDYDLRHPSGGRGIIPYVNSDYIKTINAGLWFNRKFSGEKIPFLSEVFQTCGKEIDYEIELRGYTKEFLEIVTLTIKKHELFENIEFTSPHTYLLSSLKRQYPYVKVGMFVRPIPEWMDKNLAREIIKHNALLGNIDVLHFQTGNLTKEYIEDLHKHNLIVHEANCDNKLAIENAYKMGLDQISTNDLDLALKIKTNYGK